MGDTLRNKIIIITDGGLAMGMGHVYRTLVLAKELSIYVDVEFLTQSEDVVIRKIKENKYSVDKIDSLEEMKELLNNHRPHTIIIDKLAVNEKFAEFIKNTLSAKLVIFGNVSLANQYADIVVNAIIGTDYKNRSHVDENTGTLYLQGPKYLILRREFYEAREKYQYRGKLERILLLFGGSDQANLTSKVLLKLLAIKSDFKVEIVLGPVFKFNDYLDDILKKDTGSKVVVHRDVNNVCDLMLDSDLVITSAGTTMFEAFCIGIPTIAFYQNALQREMFKGFAMTTEFDEMVDFESLIFTTYKSYSDNKKEVNKLEIGSGKGEIIDEILRRVPK